MNSKINQIAVSLNEWHTAFNDANFIIFTSYLFGQKYKELEVFFRPEKEVDMNYSRSSLRVTLKDEHDRCFSIKQFFYDWAPPAYDCPALWRNPDLNTNHISMPRPFVINQDVLWIGNNYRNQKAASILTSRTCIEITALDGKFSDENFIEIATSLRPLNLDLQQRLLKKSFAELSFHYPQKSNMVKVPISFWKCSTEDNLKFQKAYIWQDAPTSVKSHAFLHVFENYHLDSVFISDSDENPTIDKRIEYIFEHNQVIGNTIRIIVTDNKSKTLCSFPPLPDEKQIFSWEKLSIQGKEAYYAYRTKELGPHEIIWQQGENNYLMLVKPAPWTNRSWFLNLFDKMLCNVLS